MDIDSICVKLGYEIMRVRYSDELGGTLYEMTYGKTGTHVMWLDNKQENKVFCISFSTPPDDDTGVFHILEHTVLCGSGRYPVKEPYVELMKGSVNTFLNAITFPDKTVFPVASRNSKDLLNLMSVYLDAVFDPEVIRNKSIFMQEGWHIEPDEDGYSYNGVVLNEMKGAMSEEDDQLGERIKSLLFKDCCYGYCSGGYPENITSLTYERFCSCYRKYYHPSNAWIYLDGDLDLDKVLSLIAEYLGRYEKREAVMPDGGQEQYRKEQILSFSGDDITEDDGHLMIAKIICGCPDTVTPDAVSILNDVLFGSNEAPIKREILSSGIARDVSVNVDYSVAQPYVCVDLRGVDRERTAEAEKLITDCTRRLAETGLDKDALSATIKRFEFSTREVVEPSGVERCMDALNGWMYGADPLAYMTFSDSFPVLREMVSNGGFEELMLRLYGDLSDAAVLTAVPDPESYENTQLRTRMALMNHMASLDNDSLNRFNEEYDRYLEWMETEDDPSVLTLVPQLGISDLGDEPYVIPTEDSMTLGVRRLYHELRCNGIVYFTVIFNISGMSASDIGVLAKCCGIYTMMDTAQHGALELQRLVREHTGSLMFGTDVTTYKDHTGECTPWFLLKCRCLREEWDDAQRLILELLMETDMSDTGRIKEYIIQCEDGFRQLPSSAGHTLAVNRCLAAYSSESALRDYISGFKSLDIIRSLASDTDAAADRIRDVFTELKHHITRSAMIYSVTADNAIIPDILINGLPEGEIPQASAVFQQQDKEDTVYPVNCATGFSAQGMNILSEGKRFDASLRVAAGMLSLGYLWNEIRVKGGAYDTALSASRSGNIMTFSYRDPYPESSLLVNKGMSDYLRKYVDSGAEFSNFIISAVNSTEPLQSPSEAGSTADVEWLCGYRAEDDILDRKQMLECDKNKILESCEIWDMLAEKGCTCIVAKDYQND